MKNEGLKYLFLSVLLRDWPVPSSFLSSHWHEHVTLHTRSTCPITQTVYSRGYTIALLMALGMQIIVHQCVPLPSRAILTVGCTVGMQIEPSVVLSFLSSLLGFNPSKDHTPSLFPSFLLVVPFSFSSISYDFICSFLPLPCLDTLHPTGNVMRAYRTLPRVTYVPASSNRV